MTYVNITTPEYAKEHFALHEVPPNAYKTPFGTLTTKWCLDEGGGEGIAPTWVFTIGGGTGAGKSLIALNFALAALRDGARIGFLSLEMTYRQLASRFYAMAHGIEASRLERGGRFDPAARDQVIHALEESERPIFYVNEDPLPRLDHMLSLLRLWLDWGVDYFVVDYLQLCSAPDERGKAQELEAITSTLRIFAKEEQVRVLGLTQYTLEARRRMKDGISPTHDDYIGSSAISNNSHLCLNLDSSRYDRVKKITVDGQTRDVDHGRTWLTNTKSRVGPTGELPFLWDYRTLTCRETKPDEEHLWPE